MNKKVYCSKCGYFVIGNAFFDSFCTAPKRPKKSNWYEEYAIDSPEILNKNNSCKLYKERCP